MIKLILAALFCALWLCDTALTIAFVNAGGHELEANPLMRFLLAEDVRYFILAKAGVLMFFLPPALYCSKPWVTWIFVPLNLIYGFVFVLNWLMAGS